MKNIKLLHKINKLAKTSCQLKLLYFFKAAMANRLTSEVVRSVNHEVNYEGDTRYFVCHYFSDGSSYHEPGFDRTLAVEVLPAGWKSPRKEVEELTDQEYIYLLGNFGTNEQIEYSTKYEIVEDYHSSLTTRGGKLNKRGMRYLEQILNDFKN